MDNFSGPKLSIQQKRSNRPLCWIGTIKFHTVNKIRETGDLMESQTDVDLAVVATRQ